MNIVIIKFLQSLSKEEAREHFNKKPTEQTIGKPIPSPRSWEIVDNILKMGIKNEAVLFNLIAGAVGTDTATKFCTFKSNFETYDLMSALEDRNKINVSKLDDVALYDMCDQFVTLVKNNFFNFGVGTIYKNVCELLLYLLKNKKHFFYYIVNKIDISNDKLRSIFSLYKTDTNLDVEDIIFKEVV